jgi:ribosomal protein L7Ae-like RNA K-turn-binding protein
MNFMADVIQNLTLDKKTVTLVGFAIKSGQAAFGFETIRRLYEKDKLVFIMINNQISDNSYKKICNLSKRKPILIVKTEEKINWQKTWGIEKQKILGIINSTLGRSIIKNLRQA